MNKLINNSKSHTEKYPAYRIDEELGPYTGCYWWSYEEATRQANIWTKRYGRYNTAIAATDMGYVIGETKEECWAITNRYDPRIIARFGKMESNHDA
jgi:hypothetical protein